MFRSWASTDSIVSDYRLHDWGMIPGRGIGFDFPLASCPHQLLGPHSLLSNGYRGSFPGGKALPGCNTEQSPLSSAKVKNEQEL
jgi:hypothetical protein